MQEELQREWEEFATVLRDSEGTIEQITIEIAAINQSSEAREINAELMVQRAALDVLSERLATTEEALKFRDRAARNKNVAALLAVRRVRKRQQLERLQAVSDVPPEVMEDLRERVWTLEAPLSDLERAQTARAEEIERTGQAMGVLRGRLRGIRREPTKKLHEAEIARQEKKKHLTEWSTRDREHLEWVLKNTPEPHAPMFRAYVERHPEDDVSELAALAGVPAFIRAPRRSGPVGDEATWEFVLLKQPQSQEVHPLPTDHGEAVATLRELFRKCRIWADPSLLLQRLEQVTRLPRDRRLRMKQIVNAFPLGWKILRIDHQHRALLNIKEEERVIEFVVVARKEAYQEPLPRGLRAKRRTGKKQ